MSDVVLVHGAWHGSWSWRRVLPTLWAAGLLAGFVPAHLQQFRVARGRPVALAVAAVRLPLQAPMVAAALRVARGADGRRP